MIIVMSHGRITEQGTYKELMDKKGAFAEYILQYLSTVDEIDGAGDDVDGVCLDVGLYLHAPYPALPS
jgi:ATP-binding cassette subfamily C (CFTR/MRP) protein 1